MDADDFSGTTSGHMVPTISNQLAFVPNKLPPNIKMDEIALALSEASHALGELKGACRRLSNPYILIDPLKRREALSSSAMEGTHSSIKELAISELDETSSTPDTIEVRNYLRSLDESIGKLSDLPISHRLIRGAHKTLLAGVGGNRGQNKRPGDYKKEQNWIGGYEIESARFIPPPPEHALSCMDDLEAYLNREQKTQPECIIDMALVHYQIETIHPFADGNGRIGRLLISLMAVSDGVIDMPALYMSPALEREKNKYIDLMLEVSKTGKWENWINFFFKKITESCAETVRTIDKLISLQANLQDKARQASRSANPSALVEMLFEKPVFRVSDVEKKLGLSYQTSRNAIRRLVEIGILTELNELYPTAYASIDILIISDPTLLQSSDLTPP